MDYKATLLAMLGLPAEATDEQISAGCADMKTAMENACSEKTALTNRATVAEEALALANRRELDRVIEIDLEEFKDAIANREEIKGQLLANREGTRKVLASLKPVKAEGEPLRTRAQTPPPLGGATPEVSDKSRRRGALINRMRAEKGLQDYEQARAAAVQADPELFKD